MPEILTVPSSSTSTVAPVVAIIFLITRPPGPITSPIFSTGILRTVIFGAYSETSVLDCGITDNIFSKIESLAAFAFSKTSAIWSRVIPGIFTSSCIAVIPSSVPVTLKSISPEKSSRPRISVRITYLSLLVISPMAIPATGFVIGTPASISASVEPHVDAIDVEPLEDNTSETTRIV